MRWVRRGRTVLRPGFERELAEEMEHHAAMLEAEGLTPGEAARRLGNDLRLREESREAWGWMWLDRLRQDARIGLRQMRRAPGFTALAVLTLGLGIGANTALFSVVNAVLLAPLPYRDAGRIVAYTGYVPKGATVSAFEQTARVEPGEVNLSLGAEAERVPAAEIAPNLFPLLGVAPSLGRNFSANETAPRENRVAILSAGLAQLLGGSELGRSITVNGVRMTVIGVMPRGFDFPGHAQLWLPLPRPWSFQGDLLDPNVIFWDNFARLRPGATLQEARNELAAFAMRPPANEPTMAEALKTVRVDSLHDYEVGNGTPDMLWMLLGAVGLVLLIGCADVANLQLARAVGRQREMAVRAALGAGRARLVRQNLTESLMLAGLGGSAGLLLAWGMLPGLRALLPASLPLAAPIGLDARVLGWTAAAAVGSGVVCGLFPALHACGVDLRRPSEGAAPERGWLRRARGGLAVAEVGLALTLLAGAGLLVRSLARLSAVNPGFTAMRVLSAKINLGGAANTGASEIRFYEALMPALGALPGVRAAALTSQLPFAQQGFGLLGLRRLEPSRGPAQPDALFSSVGPGYFGVMRIPLRAGRDFAATDTLSQKHVAVVNQALAAELWPDQSPVGKHIALPNGLANKPDWREIVGVVGNTATVLGAAPRPIVYLPLLQSPAPTVYAVLSTGSTPAQLAPAMRRAVAGVDADVPLSDIATESERVAGSLAAPRFRTILLGLFAGLALLLSAGGILGTMAYWTARRTQEIGIRMALGARPGNVVRLVVGEGMRLVGWGVALGLGGALALSRGLEHFLYQVAPRDPATLAGAAAIMLATGALACYLPARRAAGADPMIALRQD